MVTEKKFNSKLIEMKIIEGIADKSYGYGVRHIQMVCMCLSMIALFIVRSSMGVAVLAMTNVHRQNDAGVSIYEWDQKTQGLILSSFFWGYMTMQIPAGVLAKRFGGKPVLLVALVANGVLSALLPTLAEVGGWQVVCACRVMMGLTQACLFPASHTLLGRWLPDHERTSYSGIVYGGTQIGTIIAMPVSGYLAETAMGWKMIFYFISVTMFVTAVVWYFFTASSPKQHRLMTKGEREYIESGLNTAGRFSKTPWRHIFRSKALWAVLIAHTGCTCSYVLFFVDMPTYLERGLHISLKSSASLSALPYVGMWTGNIAAAYICEKIYNRGLFSIGFLRKVFNSISFFGMALGLVALSFIGPENKIMAIIVLISTLTLNGFYSAGFMVSHLDLSPNYAGVLLSLTNFVANSGSIIIPIVTSVILRNDPTDLSRWRIVFLIIAGLSVFSNIVFLIFGSAERQQWDNPDFEDRRKDDPEELKPALTPCSGTEETRH